MYLAVIADTKDLEFFSFSSPVFSLVFLFYLFILSVLTLWSIQMDLFLNIVLNFKIFLNIIFLALELSLDSNIFLPSFILHFVNSRSIIICSYSVTKSCLSLCKPMD